MTLTEYDAIAECLRSARKLAQIPTQAQHVNGPLAVEVAARFIATAIATHNSRFSREAFLMNCGLTP